MRSEEQILRHQADSHPLMYIDEFATVEDYCLRLMHLRAYEEAAKSAQNKNILEVGCNTGYGTQLLGKVCRKITGVDLSTTALGVATQKYAGDNVDYLQIDGQTLPFVDDSFNLIISFQVIEHISNYDPYLAEIKRVLAPDGVVIFTTPNALIRLDPGMKPWNEFHVKEFNFNELRQLLEAWFPSVMVRGLFATEEVYQIEYGRVQRMLEKARRDSKAILPSYETIRTSLISGTKTLLPDLAVERIRRLFRGLRATPEVASPRATLDRVDLERYSTADFFYREDSLESALDLMAICSMRAD